MNQAVTFRADDVVPGKDSVYAVQGIPPGSGVSAEIDRLYAAARSIYLDSANPAGVLMTISKGDFADVFHGQGSNELRTPVGEIYPNADSLALYAVTLGDRIGDEIKERFLASDFALGCMLDAVASAAAEKLADRVARLFLDGGLCGERPASTVAALCYSPGYCGWHLSGQRSLFEVLRPERIGISLTDGFLMQPLKSISGVVIAGTRDIHLFKNDFPYCAQCETCACRERIRALLAG